MRLLVPRGWEIPERTATPERIAWSRRALLAAGLTLAGRRLIGDDAPSSLPAASASATPPASPRPLVRNPRYTLDRPLTVESVAARHNVFDEMALERGRVWKVAGALKTDPWTVHIGGQVPKALTIDVQELARKLGTEERLYRHRCVEAWAMAVPWTGFPFRKLIDLVQPLAKARFVRMVTAARPAEMPGWHAGKRVFPYYEALSLAEASNDLAFLATGIYGHALPPQHGAPLRLVVPWKYGLKGIKSIVAFQFTERQPGTFWNELSPSRYSFESNVDPREPGQSEEEMLGTGETRPTLPYNGYGEWVAFLYA